MSSTNSSSSGKIGVATATIVAMNAMIGAGIFSIPAALASSVGPAGILTFAFVIIAVWFMAQSLAKLAEIFPFEGSFYTYAKQWGGHVFGLIVAGAYIVGLIIAMGLLARIAGSYLNDLFPFFSNQLWGAITLGILIVLNMFGATLSQTGQRILICTTVFPLIATILMCFSKANFANLTPFMPYGFTNLLEATKAVIFAFFGFEAAASLFNVVKNPHENVPKALTYSITCVGLLYLLFAISLILAIPLEYFTTPDIVLTDILRKIFPDQNWIIGVIHLAILSAIIGTVHSMIWSSSELLLSYLKQFKNNTIASMISSGTINHKVAVLIIGLGIFTTFSTLKNIDLFFSLTAMFIVFAYTASMMTLLLKKSQPFSQKVKTVIGLLTALVIFIFAVEGLIQQII